MCCPSNLTIICPFSNCYAVLAQQRESIHEEFELIKKTACITDSGSNFVKYFRLFGAALPLSCVVTSVTLEENPTIQSVLENKEASDNDNSQVSDSESQDDNQEVVGDEEDMMITKIFTALKNKTDIEKVEAFFVPSHRRCAVHQIN